jgi:UDP-N-acetylmuramate dehydrogenase
MYSNPLAFLFFVVRYITMKKQSQINLESFNTFGIPARAKFFSQVHSLDSLKEIISLNKQSKQKLWILGGGSNVLFTKDPDAWVLKNEIKGIKIIKEDETAVWVEVFGGEEWHSFVMQSLENKWYGLENLALIPGSVGASPIQNIGAYGVEVKDLISEVYAIDLESGETMVFDNEACQFSYRNSIFKQALKGKVFVYKVIFKLKKSPVVNIEYRALKDELEKEKIKNPMPLDIAKAVIAVRRSKLPDPAEIGNSGSFFKNPEISKEAFQPLKQKYIDIPNYPGKDGKIKLAAGWLIDKAGWKGYRDGNIGVHKKQALVLVNYGGGTGKEIFDLSKKIIDDIQSKFGITLVREVNVI